MNKRLFPLIALLLFFTSIPVYPGGMTDFNRNFFRLFSGMHSLQRDIHLESLRGEIVAGRGRVLTVLEKSNYRKRYRLEAAAHEASPFNLNFTYYVYFDDEKIIDLLIEDSTFDFKGQLMGITPLNSQRSGFILDIVFIEGAAVIE